MIHLRRFSNATISDGNAPTKSFPCNLRSAKESPNIVDGIVPLNLLNGICNVPNNGFASRMKSGNVPLRPLLPNMRFSNLDIRFQPSGIVPTRSSPERTSVLSSDSKATSKGSDPTMLLPSGPNGPRKEQTTFENDTHNRDHEEITKGTYQRKAR